MWICRADNNEVGNDGEHWCENNCHDPNCFFDVVFEIAARAIKECPEPDNDSKNTEDEKRWVGNV